MSQPLLYLGTLLCLFSLCDLSKDEHWSYKGETGVSKWRTLYAEHCDGKKQSPIDINTKSSQFKLFKTLGFKYYTNEPTTMTLTNNGHSVAVGFNYDTGPAPLINGAGLSEDYEMVQYHFHWGSNSSVGSEHTIDKKKYPLEMHVIHRNKKYPTIAEALGHADGLAVIGYLFEVTSRGNEAEGFKKLITNLQSIMSEGSSIDLKGPNLFSFDDLIPNYTTYNFQHFYRYDGSLTTPACNEAVIWTVMKQPIPVGETQLNVFRKILDHAGAPISDNYRPTQALNSRIVYTSVKDEKNGAEQILGIPALGMIMFLTTFITSASLGKI